MQSAQNQVARFCGRHRHGNRFSVPELADKDDVWILAHGGSYAVGEARQMRTKFSLNHLAFLARMHKLDGIFEADDVEAAGLVQVIDHRREGRRLARPG